MNFAKKCKELRMKKAVTQEQMATALNLSSQAVSKWENGVTLPDIELLPEISVYFGVTIDELFNMTDAFAKACQYDKAIACYERCIEVQPNPRYTDSPMAIAQICEITGDVPKAIQAWKTYISILNNDWNTREGVYIERANKKVQELDALL